MRSCEANKLRAWARALIVLAVVGSAGCISGSTPDEQRATLLQARDETLQTLYERDPGARQVIEKAAGYVVLKGFSLHPGLMTFAGGHITVVDNSTGNPVYNRMFRFAVGPGLAIKSHRVVMAIESRETLARLTSSPWVLGGLLEASFKFGDFGGSAAAATSVGDDVETWYWTSTGFSLEVAVGVLKVWHAGDLND